MDLFPQNKWCLNSENVHLFLCDVRHIVLKTILGPYSMQKLSLCVCQAYIDGRRMIVLRFL